MRYTDAMVEPDVFCYNLAYWIPYDPESVWQLVQRHGGYIALLPGGVYEFYIPREYAALLVMAFPGLRRQYQKDLYV
jgi:hypothetical protein